MAASSRSASTPPSGPGWIWNTTYDLAQLAIYDPGGGLLETTSASKQVTTQVPAVPEESRAKPPEVSAAARDYFTRLREQHHAQLRDRNQTSFSQFRTTPKEHHDADA